MVPRTGHSSRAGGEPTGIRIPFWEVNDLATKKIQNKTENVFHTFYREGLFHFKALTQTIKRKYLAMLEGAERKHREGALRWQKLQLLRVCER